MSYYNGQYMYLFTQQSYIINNTDKTLIRCLLIFLFSIGNCHFNDIWHFVDWINFIGIAWLCNCQKLGNEYHYVLECSSLNDKRKQLLPKYFMKRHNIVKFFELLSTKKQSLFRKLCIFIKHINKVFCTPGLPTVVP